MGRRNSEEPCGYTCPLIDEVISAIKSIEFDEDNWHDEESLIKIMENIRSDNDKLRSWGNDLCKTRDELQEEVNDLTRSKEQLEDLVEDLHRQIKSLESEIELYQD